MLTRAELVRGLAAGLAGTAAMTAGLKLEQALRQHADGPVDYDASQHVVTAAATLLRDNPRSPLARKGLYWLVHWGYGSAVGIGFTLLRRVNRGGEDRRDVAATGQFYAGCQAMALTLFPTLGGTPPPWRWRKDMLVSSLAQHALYAVTVATVARGLAARSPVADELR